MIRFLTVGVRMTTPIYRLCDRQGGHQYFWRFAANGQGSDVREADVQRWLDPDWRDRVVAWWEGYDLDLIRRAARQHRRPRPFAGAEPTGLPGAPLGQPPAVVADAPHDPFADLRPLENRQLDRHGHPVWSVERARGVQMLWGEDLTGPGDGTWTVNAVRCFGLTPAKSVLDLSAGLGGGTRAVVGAYDTWVTGLEPSPMLARMAMDRSRALGVARKAPIAHYDPETLNQAGSFDLVMGDRILHRVRDKDHFLDQIQLLTKPRGGLLFHDYVIEGVPSCWQAWNDWRGAEPQEVYPWTNRRIVDELTQRNLDVRIAEDVTAVHRGQVVSRLRALAEALEQRMTGSASLGGGVLSALAAELALWWTRLRVLGSGLSMIRYVAYRTA